MPKPLEVTDYENRPIDTYKHNWALYHVWMKMSDGTTKEGSCEGDTHMWALETFEED